MRKQSRADPSPHLERIGDELHRLRGTRFSRVQFRRALQDATRQTNSNPTRTRPPDFWLRVVILLALFLALSLWVQHHYEMSAWALLTGGMVAVLYSLLKFLSGQPLIDDGRRAFSQFLIRWDVLPVLWILFLAAGSFLSTVTLIPDGSAGERTVRLVMGNPESRSGATRTLSAGPVRFTRFTNPFGRRCVLEVEGHQPYLFELASWRGVRLQAGRDLSRIPTVIVRLPIELLAVTANATVEVALVERPGGAPDLPVGAVRLDGLTGSILFGRENPPPTSLVGIWMLEAEAEGGDPSAVAKTLRRWRHYKYLETASSVSDGQIYEITFRGGDNLTWKRIKITGEPLQDITLHQTP